MTKFTFASQFGGFDKHIRQSIRGYQDLWDDIVKFSEYFVEDDTNVIDIGCSTGTLLRNMKEHNDGHCPDCLYKGVEIEQDFFPYLVNKDNLQFYKTDVQSFDWAALANSCSLITSLFTLQFIPKRDRKKIISQIHDSLVKGGAFIFAEKTFSASPQIEDMLTFCYYDWKQQYFSEQEILEKEVQLRHMMKLLNHSEVTALLNECGFNLVQQFWQNFNFRSWIAIKTDG